MTVSLPFSSTARLLPEPSFQRPRRPVSVRVAEAVDLSRAREWATGPNPALRVVSLAQTKISENGLPVFRVITADGRAREIEAPLGSWLSDNWKRVLGGVIGLSLLPGLGGALGLGGAAAAGGTAAAAGATSLAGTVGGLVKGIGATVGTLVKSVATIPTTIFSGIGSTAGQVISPAIVQQTVQTAGTIATQQALGKAFHPADVAAAQGQITPEQAAQIKAQEQQQAAIQAEQRRQQELYAQQQAEQQRQALLVQQQQEQQRAAVRAQIQQLYQQWQPKLGEAQQNYTLASQYGQTALAAQWADYYNQVARYLSQLEAAYAQA